MSLIQQVIDDNDNLNFDKLFIKDLLNMTDAELMYASDEDVKFFLRVTEGLPKINGFSMNGLDSNGEPMAYGCGPHSVRCLREIVEIVKPTGIVEVGLNCGYSSAMWLELAPEANVFSCDISNRKETMDAGAFLVNKYRPRFEFLICDSSKLLTVWPSTVERMNADLIFIDGGHLEHHVMADIDLALKLKIKYLAFDDIIDRFGPGVMPAIRKHPQLNLVKEMGNIALYENTSVS